MGRLAAWVCAAAMPIAVQAAEYVDIPAGTLSSVLARDAQPVAQAIGAFAMRATPVTVGELQRFVVAQPAWRRGRVAAVFADADYLKGWRGPLTPGEALQAEQPATEVSWFAAQAFCEAEGARLPTWAEWEYVAAADERRRDARGDPAWRARILAWYSRPATQALPAVGGPPNAYGIRDLHGLVWEWVDDADALLVNPDSRSADDPDKLQFCGAGAIDLQQRENYAVLMRVALLSSLGASGSTSSLGFRCVRPRSLDSKEIR